MIPPLRRTPAIAVVLNDQDVQGLSVSELDGADIVELRIDLFDNFDSYRETFSAAKKKFALPIIATLRSPEEGGKRKIRDRIALYREVAEFSDFIDGEIFSSDIAELVKLTKDKGLGLICSYHNFESTPSSNQLENIYSKGVLLGAHIVKIATMVRKVDDLETLLLFTMKHKEDMIIVIGMGEKGVPSRIINPIFGSKITYASLRRQSAPGQLELSDVVHIFRCLGLR